LIILALQQLLNHWVTEVQPILTAIHGLIQIKFLVLTIPYDAFLQKLAWLEDFNLQRLADYLFIEWRSWFDQHVNSMDAVTAQYLSRYSS
jgi:hypothetical protein